MEHHRRGASTGPQFDSVYGRDYRNGDCARHIIVYRSGGGRARAIGYARTLYFYLCAVSELWLTCPPIIRSIGPLSGKAGFGLDLTIQIGTVRRTGNATGEEVGVLPLKKKPKATKLVLGSTFL